MSKLTKSQQAERETIVTALREEGGKLEDAVRVFNEKLQTAKGELEAAQTAYNEKLSTARDFAEGVASTTQEYIDDKSEKWQEGEKGQAVAEWQQVWADISLDDVDLGLPDELSEPEITHADDIENIAESAE